MTVPSKTRVAVLISGSGTNMVSLVKAAQAEDCPYEVVLVLSNIEDAAGLQKARDLGIEAIALPHRAFGKDREAHEQAVHAELQKRGVQV
ncbi:formyltransferase family protein, partial [Brevundimonas sp.]